MPKYKAVKYLRLSDTDDRLSESDSISNQRKIIDDFIKNNPDIESVSEKVDDGFSGLVFDRPAFKEMLEDIKGGKTNCVIVKDMSRFGREYIETGRYLRRVLPAYGVRFIAILDNIDTARENSADDLIVSVKSILNDSYSRDISVKTRSALAAKRKNGDYIGACAVYGYTKSRENKNRLIIDEYAASVVRDIYRMRLDGVSAARIAGELNSLGLQSPLEYKKANGLPHPTGGFADRADSKWSATTIIRILKDEIYTGVLIQGKQGTLNYKIKDLVTKAEADWIRTENAHEAIISKDDFDLLQKILNLDTRTAPGENKVYLFSGLLVCGGCGGRMTRKTVPYKGIKYFYYCCPSGGKNGCHAPVMLKESDLIECVTESLKAHIRNVASLESLLEAVDREAVGKELVKKYTVQINENERRLDQVNRFKSGLYENYIKGILSKQDYKAFKAKYSEDSNIIEAAIARLKADLDDALNNRGERLQWIEHFKQFSDLKELSRKAVVQLIQSIRVINKKTIQITFNYEADYMKAIESGGVPADSMAEREVV